LGKIADKEAVFIDRDGTINRDVPYCSRPEDFELLPGVGQGIKLLRDSGFKIIVVTNQSGIARGYFTRETLERIHNRMKEDLATYQAVIDAIYYCPHHPDEGCACRKPNPKLILDAAQDLNLNLTQSYIIGDSDKDAQAGNQAGCRKGFVIDPNRPLDPDQGIFHSFLEAVHWLLNNDKY
jgi:histidinol-phosphate phosphatase family protein